MMVRFEIETGTRICAVDITGQVARVIIEKGAKNGLVFVYIPHTTAGVMINEGADPDVQKDILSKLSEIVPYSANYRHDEGNADAHIKSVLVGNSVAIPIVEGRLALGTWQKIFFCEFDGPRLRNVDVVCFDGN